MKISELLRDHWRDYGGVAAIMRSPYIWISVVVTVACFPLWMATGVDGVERPAIEALMTIVPVLMGLTLTGVAIDLGYFGKRYLWANQDEPDDDVQVMRLFVVFCYMVLLQVLAMLAGLCSVGLPAFHSLAAIAFFMACYGAASSVAFAQALHRIPRA